MASTSGSSGDQSKRSRNVLSIEKKLEIINRLNKDESVDGIAAFYEIGRRTVYDIKNRKEEILSYASKLDSEEGSKRRKTMRSAQNEKLEEAVYLWFIQRRSKGDPISGPLLCEKALLFNQKLDGSPDFKASTGWLKNFKSRHGIRELEVQGERLSSDTSAAESFKTSFLEYLERENLSLGDVYNADETGLNWRSLPCKSLASKREMAAPGFKVSKERVTIMVCANASGSHRLPLLMIGKSKNPRCFKNVKNLPVTYKSQASAWMNSDVFLDWYRNYFIPEVKKFRKKEKRRGKVVLLLDNAPSHPDLELLNKVDENFEVRYLPPNVTAVIQPMDQGVIEKMKRMYKKDMLRRLLLSTDDEESVITFAKKLNLKDCCYMVADAWNCLTPENLRNAWNKLVGKEEDEEPDLDTVEEDLSEVTDELFSQIPGFGDCDREDAQEWLMGEDDIGFQILNEDEIVSAVQVANEDEETEDDEENNEPITHGEAFTALETALAWFERQPESCATQLLLLKRLRDLAAKKRRSNLVQKTISDYFSVQM